MLFETATLTGFQRRANLIREEMVLNTQAYSEDFKGHAGVVVARRQTPGGHAAHLLLDAYMLAENEHCLSVICSADKSGTVRNPFSAEVREMIYREMLQEVAWPQSYMRRLDIVTLRDYSDEGDVSEAWGNYLWANIVSRLPSGVDKFRIYYSDEIEIIKSWFPTKFLQDRVEIRHLKREDILDGLSGTKIREAILDPTPAGMEYLMEFCPEAMRRRLPTLRPQLQKIMENGG